MSTKINYYAIKKGLLLIRKINLNHLKTEFYKTEIT